MARAQLSVRCCGVEGGVDRRRWNGWNGRTDLLWSWTAGCGWGGSHGRCRLGSAGLTRTEAKLEGRAIRRSFAGGRAEATAGRRWILAGEAALRRLIGGEERCCGAEMTQVGGGGPGRPDLAGSSPFGGRRRRSRRRGDWTEDAGARKERGVVTWVAEEGDGRRVDARRPRAADLATGASKVGEASKRPEGGGFRRAGGAPNWAEVVRGRRWIRETLRL